MARNYPRGERAGSVWSVIVVFAILGILSLIAGYLGGQYLLRGITGEADDPSEPQETAETDGVETPRAAEENLQWTGLSLEVFRVQVGAFAAAEGAETKADMMRQEGVSAAVVTGEDGMHRVVVDVTDNRETAQRIAEHLQTDEREAAAISWSVQVPAREMMIPGDRKDDISELLQCLDELVQGQAQRPVVAVDRADATELVRAAERFAELWDETGTHVEAACADLHALITGYVLPNVRGLQEDSDSTLTRQSYIELIGAARGGGGG